MKNLSCTVNLVVVLVASGCADRSLDSAEIDANDPAATSAGSSGDATEASLFSPCERAIDCQPLAYCVFTAGEGGFCSNRCANPATDCPLPAGGDATATCIAVGEAQESVCALDCSHANCPDGMQCRDVLLGDEPVRLCF